MPLLWYNIKLINGFSDVLSEVLMLLRDSDTRAWKDPDQADRTTQEEKFN